MSHGDLHESGGSSSTISLLEAKTDRLDRFSNESAGIADLITTCYGGRNRKCAEEFVKTGKPFEEIEAKLLNGQKLQGTATAEEVHNFLLARKRVRGYPLFEKVYRISFEGMSPKELVRGL